MASKTLERKTINLALKYKAKYIFPAVVCGAEYSYYKRVQKSGSPDLNKFSEKIRYEISKLGNIFDTVNGNILGCCAETNSANKLLDTVPYLNLYEIDFSKAIRPRTMQKIKMCKNCKTIFG